MSGFFCWLRVSTFMQQMIDRRCSCNWQSVPPLWFLCFTSGCHSHRQCSYETKLWVILVTIAAMEKQHCVLCVLSTIQEYWALAQSTFMANVLRQQQYNVLMSSCKLSDILSDLNEIWIFSTEFQESSRHQIHGNASSGSSADTWPQAQRRNGIWKWRR